MDALDLELCFFGRVACGLRRGRVAGRVGGAVGKVWFDGVCGTKTPVQGGVVGKVIPVWGSHHGRVTFIDGLEIPTFAGINARARRPERGLKAPTLEWVAVSAVSSLMGRGVSPSCRA